MYVGAYFSIYGRVAKNISSYIVSNQIFKTLSTWL